MKFLFTTLIAALSFFHASAQNITIVNPNGSEILYSCQSYTIKWNTSGTLSNYYDISYSLDGGTIWASITSNFLSTNGQFVWTVPNVQSSSCLIRVRDSQNSTVSDVSNAFFTINIPVTLISPNGGETIQGGDTYTINWNAVGTSNTYNLYYSTNGGSTWTTIVTNYATVSGLYSWTVPNIPSTTVLIRVNDYVTPCMQDQSNAVFTIIPDDPILLYPNGSETLFSGCSYNITWLPATFYSTVMLEYSTNNGSSWTTILSSTPNDGNQAWTVPAQFSGNCLIRASNTANVAVNDVSNAVFTIAPPITVVAPNGGETLFGCSNYTITWARPAGCITSFALYYSTDNGSSWNFITSVNNTGSGTTQSYLWAVPGGIASSSCLVRVADPSSSSVSDASNAAFSIAPNNDITVTAPNGGEVLNALTSTTVTWTNLPAASGQYTLQYSTNGGSNWTNIASGVTGNAYNWSVPNIPSSNCMIRVLDAVNTCKFDISNAVFTIAPPLPVLLYPNGGEVFAGGCTYTITWDAATFYSNVRLDYSADGGTTWINITASTANDGNQAWTAPYVYGANYKIKIANVSDLLTTDISAAPFTVQNPITVVAPNGGETLFGCSNYTITWARPAGCITSFALYYSTDNGSSWNFITSVNNTGSGTTQSYLWAVPGGIASSSCLVRVADPSSSSVSDASNAAFSIAPNNDITVTAPNGGEVLNALTSTTVTWTNLPAASGQYTLQYSTNGGSNWTNIASGVTGNAYNWSVPNIPSSNCMIRVLDAVNTCKFDISNAVFTIAPPLPVLLYPNGGEVFAGGCTYTITWDAATFYSNVRLDYSADGGTTWINITASTANDGNQAWTAPYVYGANYKIKIANVSDLLTTDISAAPFTVQNPITVVAPNGGETLFGCSNYTITWARPAGCITSFALYYSTDNGSSWNFITSVNNTGSGTTQSYLWAVPGGIASSSCLVRVTDPSSSSVSDASNAAFSIAPNNDITLTAPNGGEVLNALTSTTVTWTNLPAASGQYTLQYSTNGGSNWTNIASGVTGNAYNWSVPNIPSSNCMIRVLDAVNTCKFDISNAVFTIAPPLPVLLYPNGGEVFAGGCTYTITWDAATFYSNVRLDYSADGGTTWINITASTANDGNQAWTAPYVYGANYKIKIANVSDLLTTDISAAPFTVQNPITVVAPNGGETLFGCSNYTITWARPAGCITSFALYYSTDNGSSWNFITSVNNTGSGTTQSYLWAVPGGIASSSCLVRVADPSSSSVSDASNAAFSIAPNNDITVTAPNGGEVLNALTSTTVTWTNLPAASGQYTLQYSTNGGSNWTNIASGVTGNAYNWSVPNIPSSNCMIRVLDAVNTCKFDISNAVFTIAPPLPVLLYPNGGEVFAGGCTYTITWDAATFYSNVRLDYSADGGTTWINITASTANDGNQAWTAPYVYGANYKIKIANVSDLLTTDISAAPFTVQNPITVVAPNGGETLFGCSNYTITWARPAGCITSFALYYSTDNGSSWNFITSVNNTGSGTTQSYLWAVPGGIASSSCLVRVTDPSSSSVSDASNAAFSIAPNNDITLTAPNGGEVLNALTSTTVTWTNLPAASGQYTLQYSTNGGSNWTNIASGVTGNAYNWSVPNIPSSNCMIRVLDAVNTCKFDISNAVFTILPATPVLLAPNGGEVLYSGTSYTIVWDAATFYSTVRLDYSTDGGTTWINILTSTANDGNQTWTVPNTPSLQCLVRASNTSNLPVNDVSNAVFTIKPAVTVITPNGNDGITNWGGCTVTSITFNHSPAYSSWNIYYSLNGGSTWTTIASSWTQTANPATYNWNIPNTSSSNVLVKVEPAGYSSLADQSDAPIAITKPVTIIQPNFGGIMQVGSVYNISWNSDGISNIYDIFFSDNGGSTWSTLVLGYNTSTNTYPWTIPNSPSSNCKIRVRDNINSCKEDTSDVAFTISSAAPALTILSPNGGESLSGCTNKIITWTEPSAYGTYDLSYSSNSGATWIPIATNYATTSMSYNWVVPNLSSSTVLVKVRAAGTAIEDLSNALFTIQNGSLVVSTADTTVCPGSPVQLNASGAATYTWTPSAGLSNPNIANPVATPASTTTYTVQYMNGGCSLQDQVTITTNSAGAVTAGVSISATAVNICSGSPVTFTATPVNGGTLPTYQWKINNMNVGTNSPNFTTSTLANNDAVTVTLTSSLSCVTGNPAVSNSITMSVSTTSTPSVSISAAATTICSGTAVTFTASAVNGGTSPVYQWKVDGMPAGANSPSFTSSSLTNGAVITATLTPTSGCAAGTSVTSTGITMTVNNVPSQPGALSGAQAVCAGTSQSYTFTPVAGATGYAWSLPTGWTGTSATNSINVLSGAGSGVISVTALNTCGNSSAQSLPVSVYNVPNVTANATATSICAGEQVTLSGTGAVSYNWTGASNGAAFTPAYTATYTVTGTDIHGCTDTDMITVTVNTLPNVTANATSAALCGGGSVTLTGGGASSYTWNNGVSNGIAFSPASTQTYTVTGTNANGCANTAQVTVSMNALPVINAGPDQTVCSGTPVTLLGTGGISYTWSGGISNGVAFSAASTNTYTVTGTAANGCTNTDQVTVTVNATPAVTANATTTNVCIGGSVTLSGSGANSYTWNNGVSNGVAFSPSSTQTYTVTGTSSNGCTNTGQVTVSVNSLPAITANASALSVCAGSPVTLSGAGANNYSWNNGVLNGVASIPAATQTYTVTGTAANGCTNTAQVTVTVNTVPTVTANTTAATACIGGTVTLSGSGANSYTWNNGVSNGVAFSPSSTQTYTVTGTSVNGCTDTDQITVTVSSLPSVTANAPALSVCAGSPVTLTGAGANNYSWNNGVLNGVSFVPATTQTYTVTGTSASGCTNTAQVTITVNALPVITAGGGGTICEGSGTLLTAGGAAIYSWNNGAGSGSSVSVSPLASTIYTVTGTSLAGCTATASVPVTVTAAPELTVSGSTAICAGDEALLNVSGAAGYNWSNGAGTGSQVTVSPVSTTTYTVTGNSGGCVSTAQVTVTVNSLPVIAINGNTEVCPNGSAVLTANGGVTYNWNNGMATGPELIVAPSATTTYTVTGTSANGCVNTDNITVTVLAPPVPVISINGNVLQTGTYSTYQWFVNNTPIPGATTQTWTFTENGSYYVEVTDGNGCEGVSAISNVASVSLEETQENTMMVYPNPAKEAAIIDFGNLKGVKTVRLMDMTGKTVLETHSSEQLINLQINLATGFYQVVVTDEDQKVHLNQRLMVQQD